MGTDYFIACHTCKKNIYWFKRTLGHTAIINNEKTVDFVNRHRCECGPENIQIISEHDEGYLYEDEEQE